VAPRGCNLANNCQTSRISVTKIVSNPNRLGFAESKALTACPALLRRPSLDDARSEWPKKC
jgi:hypothetical protein